MDDDLLDLLLAIRDAEQRCEYHRLRAEEAESEAAALRQRLGELISLRADNH